MKLPDFSSFAPLNETREQMKAELPENLNFVTIDERLTNADLEKKRAKPAPAEPAKGKSGTHKPKTGAAAQAFTNAHPGQPVKAVFDPAQILVLVQLAVLFDVVLVAVLFSFFGAPWDKGPPIVEYHIYSEPAPEPAPESTGGSTPPNKRNIKVRPQRTNPNQPFYRRREFTDENGVVHTIIEQLPYHAAKKAKPSGDKKTPPTAP